ncbi:MAG: hypothetical protein GXY83_00480 [Rhodopirellula sp.]|nr:hypothetical protein [Rhodopirellula sp.]
MSAVYDLVINLTSKTTGFTSGMKGARGELSATAQAAEAASARISRGAMMMGGAFLGALGVGSLSATVAKTISLAKVQEDAERKLGATLAATGNAAGFTVSQLKDYAGQLQSVTNFGDEAIINSQALLATFKQVKGDNFNRATEAILDMAAVMGGDLKGATIQLGKALNDPIKGVSALSDVGVSFTDQQRDMIKTMMEAGDVAGAQGVILDELAGEFGGAAKAMADPMTQLTNTLGDIGETIGAEILPYVRLFATDTQSALTGTADAADRTANAVGWIGTAFGAVSDIVDLAYDGIQAGQAVIVGAFASIASGVAGTLELAEKLPGVGGKFGDLADSARVFADSLQDATDVEWKQFDKAFTDKTPSERAREIAEQMAEARSQAVGAAAAFTGLGDAMGEAMGEGADEAAGQVGQILSRLQEQIDTLDMGDAAKTVYDAMAAGATGDQLDQVRQMAEQLERAKAEAAEFAGAVQEAERLRREVMTPAEVAQSEIDRINSLFSQGFIDGETQARAVEEQMRKIRDVAVENADETTRKVEEASGHFAGAMERGSAKAYHAILQAATRSGSGNHEPARPPAASPETHSPPAIAAQGIQAPALPPLGVELPSLSDLPAIGVEIPSLPDLPPLGVELPSLPDLPPLGVELPSLPDLPAIAIEGSRVPELPPTQANAPDTAAQNASRIAPKAIPTSKDTQDGRASQDDQCRAAYANLTATSNDREKREIDPQAIKAIVENTAKSAESLKHLENLECFEIPA